MIFKRFIFILTVLTVMLLAACQMPVASPTLQRVTIIDNYNSRDVTVTYSWRDFSGSHYYSYALYKLSGNDYQLVQRQAEVAVTELVQASFQGLTEGKYRIDFSMSLLTGGGYKKITHLDQSNYFSVDLSAPVDPVVSVDSGTYGTALSITISHIEMLTPSGSNVSLYYTLDGSDPGSSSTRYTGGIIQVSSAATLKVIAIDDAGNRSSAVQKQYVFEGPAISLIQPSTLNINNDNSTIIQISGKNYIKGDTNVTITSPGVVRNTIFVTSTLIYAEVDVTTGLTAGTKLGVTVTTVNGNTTDSGSVSLIQNTTVAAPVITGISPASLNVETASNAVITINGTNFNTDSRVSITTGGIVKSVVRDNSSRIYATVDVTSLTAGSSLNVTVTTVGGSDSNSSLSLVNYGTPTVTRITPNQGDIVSNNTILSIQGSNFSPGAVVQVYDNSTTAATIVKTTVVNSDIIYTTVDLTPCSAGQGFVRVTNSGGGVTDTVFTIYNSAQPAPTISGISPGGLNIETDSDTVITITGTNFEVNSTVAILSPAIVKSVSWGSSTKLYATVDVTSLPVVAGNIPVWVTTSGGTVMDNSTLRQSMSPPVITGISPSSGSIDKSELVISIKGSNFSPTASVSLADNSSTTAVISNTVVVNQSLIYVTANLTTCSAGSGLLTVTNRDTSNTNKTFVFEANRTIASPVISSVSPSALNIETNSSALLTITGTNFTSDINVSMSPAGSIVKSVTRDNSTSLKVLVDVTGVGAEGNATITVANSAGNDSNSSISLSYLSSPVIYGVTPGNSTKGATNVVVSIQGNNFSPDGNVTIKDINGSTMVFTQKTWVNTGLVFAVFDINATAVSGNGTIHVINKDGNESNTTFVIN